MGLFKVGEIVGLKSDPNAKASIISIKQVSNPTSYEIFYNNETKIFFESQLVKLSNENDTILLKDINFLKSLITSHSILSPSLSNLFSLRSGKIEFVPYQYRPVMKLLKSDEMRLLIADEVGVGKTIETGLIIKELKARNKIESILVICPKPLVTEKKWYHEMKRFDEEFYEIDGDKFRFCINETDFDGEWPDKYKQCIIPFSLFDSNILLGTNDKNKRKQKGLLNLDIPPKFDLVIIDEAHNIKNPDSFSYNAARYFCDNANAVLLLTATPIQLGNFDLFVMLNLLRPDLIIDQEVFKSMAEPNAFITKAISECRAKNKNWIHNSKKYLESCLSTQWGNNVLKNTEQFHLLTNFFSKDDINDETRLEIIKLFEDMYSFSSLINRTKRRDIQKDYFCVRKPKTIEIEFTETQKELYQSIIEVIYKCMRRTYSKVNPQFLMTTIQRQASSCLFGLKPLLSDIFEKKLNELDYAELFGDSAEDNFTEVAEDISAILNKIKDLDTTDNKLNTLKTLILQKNKQLNNKILLFSTYIHTLKYLYKNLSNTDARIGIIYGSIKDQERTLIKERFSKPKDDPDAIDILLSSEIGCEGLDFQFCDMLVNYDIPWNPMKIEQRIGRIDRFGQESQTVSIINLITPDTIDAEIYNRCFQRIGIFENSIGSSEEILGSITEELNHITNSFELTEQERKEKLQQLSDNKIREAKELEDLEKKDIELFGLNLPNSSWEKEIRDAENSWLSKLSIKNFVEYFLKYKINSMKDFIIGDKDIQSLRLSKEDREELLKYFNNESKYKKDKSYRNFVNWLKNSTEAYLKITFEYDKNTNSDVQILNSLHPLVQEAANYFKLNTKVNINLKIEDNNLPKGIFAFGIFSWEKIGTNNHSKLVSICQNKFVEQNLLELLSQCEISSYDKFLEEDDETFLNKKHYELWEKNLDDFKILNKSIINKKLETINISYQNLKVNYENLISKIKDEKILIMKKGQLKNRQKEYDIKIKNLNKKLDEIDILHETIALGYLEVV